MTNRNSTRQVLFVDDEPDFLGVVREVFESLSAGRWAIHCATTADAALEILKQEKIDLAVVDANMPLLDGIQFLGVLERRYPELKKVSLTAFATEDRRTACLAAGAELFIEKPHSVDGYKSIYAMLDDLISWVPQQGFQGMLRRVGLQDVIQMECLGRNSSVVEVHNQHTLGRIYIEEGCIIHATDGERTGERALQQLLALAAGSFELSPYEAPSEKTISGPWEFLLMEAARMRDELAAQAPATAPEADLAPPVERPTAPPASAKAAAQAARQAKAKAAPPVAMVISETLICSGVGKVLYEAGCADMPARLHQLKQMARFAAQLTKFATLGHFDRLELHFPRGRAVAQVQSDRMIYVTATQPPDRA